MTTSLSTIDAATPNGFAALHLSEPVMRALDEIGYTDPTPVQSATYPVAVAGKDVIVQARTGTGKTAAFGIPLVDKLVNSEPCVQALVLAPTRELAVQSQREIARIGQHKGLHTVAIYGGAPMGRQIEELQSGAQIVSGTPGRVLDHLRRGTLEPSRLKVLVLDEMDEMLSMGFAKELNAILELIPPRGKRQTMCFSATVDGEVRRHAERHMHEPEMISLSSDAVAATQITHQVYMVSGRDRVGDLVRVLEVEDPESAIIFCNMRSETERVATALKQAGFNADWLNGDLPQKDRERIMASTREGKLRYLVATDVAARGIDISHLTHVINYTFPESAAVYVHRTGRTGRAGRTGSAVSLVGPEELGRLYYLRLEYKISPIERSLPTSGERKTRQEIDRLALLDSAFSDAPSPTDLAVARRLFTHPDGERILAGLLRTFFGTREDPDEEAAAARRSRLAANVEAPASDEGDRRHGPRGEGRGRDRHERQARRNGREPRGREREGGEGREGGGRRERREGRGPRGREREGGEARETHETQDLRVREPGESRGRERESGEARESRGRERESAEVRGREHEPEEGRGSRGRERKSGEARERERESGEPHEARGREREPGDARAGRGREREPGESGAADRDAGEARDREFDAPSGREREPSESRGREREPGEARGREPGEGRARERRRERPRGETSEPGRGETGDLFDRADVRASLEETRELFAQDGVLLPDAERVGSEQSGRRERQVKANDRAEPRRGRSRPPAPQPSAADDVSGDEAAEGEYEGGGESSAHLEGLLYLNLGKRDGIRVGEVAKLLRESCELTRGEIGRIRVRDRYTFVDVPEERLDTIISTLSGQVVHDKALAPERAKSAKN
jgi:ATP-dependent RNA helicase DeaD